MKTLNECSKTNLDKQFSVTEKRKTYILTSENKFICSVVAIDNCVFANSDSKRCDYLFLIDTKRNENKNLNLKKSTAFYVELKGSEHKAACDQLYEAIYQTKSQISNYEIQARVISNKGNQPNILNSSSYRKVKKLINNNIEFEKVHRGNNYSFIEKI